MAGRRRAARRTVKRGRVYHRDHRGRFASTGTTTAPDATKRKRRRRAALAGSAVVAGAVGIGQARNPASRTRTAMTRHRLVNRHVARAEANHERMALLRAKANPTKVTIASGLPFDSAARKAARAEARKLTAGYRRQAKRTHRAHRPAKR